MPSAKRRSGRWCCFASLASLAFFSYIAFFVSFFSVGVFKSISKQLPASFQECPASPHTKETLDALLLSSSGGNAMAFLPQQKHAAEVLLGESVHAREHVSERRKSKRVLFLSSYFHYTKMMSRWYYHMYEAGKTLPHWETYLWGPGFPLYDSFCRCVGGSANEGIPIRDSVLPYLSSISWAKEVVRCKPKSKEEQFNFVDRDKMEVPVVSDEDRARCTSVELLSFATQAQLVFGTHIEPFDIIFIKWEFGHQERQIYFDGVSNKTVLAFYEHEWHRRTLSQVASAKPDVVFFPYVDQFEENYGLRQFVRDLDLHDPRASAWFPPPDDSSQSNGASPQLRAASATAEGKYSDVGLDMLAAYAPLGVLPSCHSHWQQLLISSEQLRRRPVFLSRTLRAIDVLTVGRDASVVYPTRAVMSRVVEQNYGNLRRRVHQFQHPGYTELKKEFDEVSAFKGLVDRTKEYRRYLNYMERSKICFIGGISTWTIRKYKEAMVAGCLVVGDVPADHYLSQFIVNLNITWPGYVNLDEDKDLEAVAKLSALHQPSSVVNNEIDTPSSIAAAGYVPLMPNPYEELNEQQIDEVAKTVADRLNQVLQAYERGVYSDMMELASRTVLRQYSWQRVLTEWIEPAIDAHRQGERGWLRMPKYFQNHGRKYKTRHRFLLMEWLVRRITNRAQENSVALEGRESGVREELAALSYDELLSRATSHLRNDGASHSTQEFYFDKMSDFDVEFIKARRLYQQNYPMDRFSHIRPYHIRQLY